MDDAKFVIDGREYDVPEMGTFSMGETLILYEYTGLGLDELEDHGGHPGLIAALMHIAYARRNPGMKKTRVRELIENSNLAEALEKFGEDDASPPASNPAPTASSAKSSSGKTEPSGNASEKSSADSGVAPSPIGISA